MVSNDKDGNLIRTQAPILCLNLEDLDPYELLYKTYIYNYKYIKRFYLLSELHR